MTREIQHYVVTRDGPTRTAVVADSAITALQSFIDILAEISKFHAKTAPHIRFSELHVASLSATVEFELPATHDDSPLTLDAEEEIERQYLDGWATLTSSPVVPPGFTPRAIDAAAQLVNLFARDEFRELRIRGASSEPITVTASAIANIQELRGTSFTDLGGLEGRLETISLARRETFTVRDSITNSAVKCTIGKISLEQIKDALGKRVVVYGEVTFNRFGIPSEVSPVFDLVLIDDAPMHVERVLGLGKGLSDGLPSELTVKRAWDGG